MDRSEYVGNMKYFLLGYLFRKSFLKYSATPRILSDLENEKDAAIGTSFFKIDASILFLFINGPSCQSPCISTISFLRKIILRTEPTRPSVKGPWHIIVSTPLNTQRKLPARNANGI